MTPQVPRPPRLEIWSLLLGRLFEIVFLLIIGNLILVSLTSAYYRQSGDVYGITFIYTLAVIWMPFAIAVVLNVVGLNKWHMRQVHPGLTPETPTNAQRYVKWWIPRIALITLIQFCVVAGLFMAEVLLPFGMSMALLALASLGYLVMFLAAVPRPRHNGKIHSGAAEFHKNWR